MLDGAFGGNFNPQRLFYFFSKAIVASTQRKGSEILIVSVPSGIVYDPCIALRGTHAQGGIELSMS